jgi:hypothetical protein
MLAFRVNSDGDAAAEFENRGLHEVTVQPELFNRLEGNISGTKGALVEGRYCVSYTTLSTFCWRVLVAGDGLSDDTKFVSNMLSLSCMARVLTACTNFPALEGAVSVEQFAINTRHRLSQASVGDRAAYVLNDQDLVAVQADAPGIVLAPQVAVVSDINIVDLVGSDGHFDAASVLDRALSPRVLAAHRVANSSFSANAAILCVATQRKHPATPLTDTSLFAGRVVEKLHSSSWPRSLNPHLISNREVSLDWENRLGDGPRAERYADQLQRCLVHSLGFYPAVLSLVARDGKLPLGSGNSMDIILAAHNAARAADNLTAVATICVGDLSALAVALKPNLQYLEAAEMQSLDPIQRFERLSLLIRSQTSQINSSMAVGTISSTTGSTAAHTGGVPAQFKKQYIEATASNCFQATVSDALALYTANKPTMNVDLLETLALGGTRLVRQISSNQSLKPTQPRNRESCRLYHLFPR